MDPPAGRAALPKPGDTVDRYRVVAEVARGGMAAVFAVQRSSVGGFEKVLAMKMMLPHLATERHFVEMFLDEARLASQIEHPNVCPVLDVGQVGGVPFLLMELVKGRSLATVNERADTSKEARSTMTAFWLEALSQAAEGLHAAHVATGRDGVALGVVHRDVSPQNLLIGFDGRVRVVDFGIAAGRGRLVGTRTGEIKGKFAYLAPEQISREQPVSSAADIWALGVVAWELFAGRRLFAADEEAKVLWNVMSARVPELSREAPGLPAAASKLIMRCLEREPSGRPAQALDIARELGEAASIANGGRSPDLAAHMAALFGDDRRADEARYAGFVEASPTALGPSDAETQITTVSRPRVEVPARGPRRLVYWVSGGALASALAIAGALWARPTPAHQGTATEGTPRLSQPSVGASSVPEPRASAFAATETASSASASAASITPRTAPAPSAAAAAIEKPARPLAKPASAARGTDKLMRNPF